MELWYEGTEISGYVIPSGCIHKEASHGKADVLEMTFRRSAAWNRWDPETDDIIQLTHGDYDTGRMYVNTVVPEGNEYRLIATALPSAAERKAWGCYRNISLISMMRRMAEECDIQATLYGIDGDITYDYLQRKNEGCAAFLDRLCLWEGAALKTYDTYFRGIGIASAQERGAARSWHLDAEQDGVRYLHQPGKKWSAVVVRTPWAEAIAVDSDAKNGYKKIITDLPAMDKITAGRWARGILLSHNREADRLRIETRFDPGAEAMARAEITGNTGAAGSWIIDEVEHDLMNERTSINLLRVVDTIR